VSIILLFIYLLENLLIGRKGVQGAEPGPVLTWSQRVKIAFGAAKGLEFLQEKVQPSIVHRDVRSSNVLLFDDFQAKIGDFNLTSASSETAARLHSTRVLGTFGYHAPEYAFLFLFLLNASMEHLFILLVSFTSSQSGHSALELFFDIINFKSTETFIIFPLRPFPPSSLLFCPPVVCFFFFNCGFLWKEMHLGACQLWSHHSVEAACQGRKQ